MFIITWIKLVGTCNIEYRGIHKNGLVLGGYRNVLGSFYLDNDCVATMDLTGLFTDVFLSE